jgi:hypothetical protein
MMLMADADSARVVKQTSTLDVRSEGCSRRTTRAIPHAPPHAAPRESCVAAPPRAWLPSVSISSAGAYARVAVRCASARTREAESSRKHGSKQTMALHWGGSG